MPRVLFLSKADGERLLAAPDAYPTLVPRLAEAMRATARGATTRRNRTSFNHRPPDGLQRSLMVGPAVAAGLGAAIRAYTGVRGRKGPKPEPSGIRLLFEYETMTLQMLAIEGNLHPARTGGGGAAVVQALAPRGAAAALIGSGRIAAAAARAVLATCEPASLAIYSPTPAHRESLAAELNGCSGVPVRAAASPAEAMAGARVVLSATEADPPALDFSAVEPGAVVVSLGLNELSAETVLGGQLLATGLKEILEDERQVEPFRTLYQTDPPGMRALDFCDVLANDLRGWDRSRTTWVFALGTAVWDLALMRWLYERAVAAGVGTWLEA
jgi:ornithine cyclodeaminase/alanine dehydrogenase-like protein (mu-crystallin family)